MVTESTSNRCVAPCRRAAAARAGAGAVLALLAAVVLVVVGAAPAAAHASLVDTEPPTGATLGEAPERVLLRFDEPVEVGLGSVTVYDPAGGVVAAGRPQPVPGSADAVTFALPDLAPGTYVVVWRATSADGHPIKGALTFAVEEASVADTGDLVSGLLARAGASSALERAVGVVRWIGYVGLALVLGTGAFVALAWPAGARRPAVRRTAVAGWVVALGAGLLAFALHGPYATGLPAGEALDPDLWRDVLDTRFGAATFVRLGVLVAALPLIATLDRAGRTGWRVAGAGVAVALALSVAATGHAASGDHRVAGVAAAAVHVLAMTTWLGGLVILAVAVLTGRHGASVRSDEPAPARSVGAAVAGGELVGDRGDVRTGSVAVHRFSAMAGAAALAAVLTGAVQTWRSVDEPLALLDSRYGRTLALKLVLVAGLLALGAWSRWLVRRRWPALDALRRSAVTELVVGAAVLAVTASLVGTAPPALVAGEPFAATLVQGNVVVDVSVEPARVGSAELHLIVSPPGGALQQVSEAQVRLDLPERDLGPLPVLLEELGPNHYVAPSFQLPYPGDWSVDIRLLTADGRLVQVATTMPVAG